MPKNPISFVKGKVEGKWLDEVRTDDGKLWLTLDDWKAIYEPKKEKKEDSQFKKDMKAKVATKAKQTILNKLEKSLSNKLVKVVLEVIVKILNQIEKQISTKDTNLIIQKNIINTMNAILLSYRFETKDNQKKILFLRTTAINQFTDGIDSIGNDLSSLQTLLRTQLGNFNQIRTLISDQIDTIITITNEKINQTVSTKTNSLLTNIDPKADAILDAAGIKKPPVEEKLQEISTTKDEFVQTLRMVIKDGILNKLDTINVTISNYIDILFVQFTLLKDKRDSINLYQEIHTVIDKMYNEMVNTIHMQVSDAVSVLGSMMDKKDDDDDIDDNGNEIEV